MVDRRALVVARRAAAVAGHRGVDLPGDLALWRLAGGRPRVAPADGEPEELGELLEQTTRSGARRRLGAHYTPREVARELAARALDGQPGGVVGDPACGGGAILLAVARRLADLGERPAEIVDRLWGHDVDPVAVATTEASLAIWAGVGPTGRRCTVGDALAHELAWPALDVVVGNPPFLSPLTRSTGRSPAVAARLRERFGDAAGPYTDAAALFLLVACGLVRPGGTVALLQPVSVLTNRDAAGTRAAVDRVGRVREVWVPPAGAFDAAVHVCVPVLDIDDPSFGVSTVTGKAPRSWAVHLSGSLGVPSVDLDDRTLLEDEAEVVAAFRTEYYGTVPHVHEEEDLPDGRRLLTTGLVDLGGIAWGERPARAGGRSWQRPVVDVGALEGRAARWLERTSGPKVVVATQTKVVEAAVDADGRFVAGVPLLVARAKAERVWHVAAALAAPAVSAWLFHQAAGSGRSPTSLRTSAPLLRLVPLPVDPQAWDEGTAAFRARDLDGFAVAMGAAYGVGAEIGEWWVERARSVWSPAVAVR